MSGKWSDAQHARYRATIEQRRLVVPNSMPVRSTPETDGPWPQPPPPPDPAVVVDPWPAVDEALTAIRHMVLRVDDRAALLLAGNKPTVPLLPTKDPDLVAALRALHLRLLKVERASVTTGDWEEALDEVLRTVRDVNRKLAKVVASRPRNRKETAA